MRVFSNLAISLDGKIADRRTPHKMLGTPLDRKMMDVIRRQADVIVFGAQTLRSYPHPARVKNVKGKRTRKQPVNAIITASGELDPAMPFWDVEDTTRFVFTTERGFEKALASARDRAFVVKAGKDRVQARKVLERFKASGLNNVLVEGGGEIVSIFLEERLLQEMHVTLTPWILGGRENPTLVGGEGLTSWSGLKILKMKRVGEEVYFHYKVKGAKKNV